ncbi:hypothetical protein IQ226_16270 [Dolichospermum sp. LEGE 00240]|uniref:hypothetical protein n=1 Tax=Dolichospermum sp. LEGE 00240 TaxID=1828603 RepID=UPI0018830D6C|nr:hypothetical protein [Dolichospermum sp. LEGE 00240]MBE9250664.1 hypothetical protein [Dolichospermum sp. LEGE 00240]MDM3853028.1 hypothetical protein [Aphanizomenon gracile PMC627.10]
MRSLFRDVVRAIAVGDVGGDSEALLQAVRFLGCGGRSLFGMWGMRSLFGDVVRAIAVGDVEGDSEALLQAVRCLGM